MDDPQTVATTPNEYEEHLFNNTYPRGGNYHIIQAQATHDPWLTRHTNLNQAIDYLTGAPTGLAPSRFALGRNVNINIGLVNDGLIDISYASGITLKTTIYRLNAANVRTGEVFSTTDVATRGGVGEGEVTIYSAAN